MRTHLAITLAATATPSLTAQVLVSAEVSGSALVAIDTATMNIEVIGNFGVEIDKAEFAWFEGTLYAVGYGDRLGPTLLRLFEVDPASGSVTPIADIATPDGEPGFLRGLTADDEGLLVLESPLGDPFFPDLHRLDHRTGQAIPEDPTVCDTLFNRARDIEVDPVTGELLLFENLGGVPAPLEITSIDLVNGTCDQTQDVDIEITALLSGGQHSFEIVGNTLWTIDHGFGAPLGEPVSLLRFTREGDSWATITRRILFRPESFSPIYLLYGLATATDPALPDPASPSTQGSPAAQSNAAFSPAPSTLDASDRITPPRARGPFAVRQDLPADRIKLGDAFALFEGTVVNIATGTTRELTLPNGASGPDVGNDGIDLSDAFVLIGDPGDATSGPSAGAAHLVDASSGEPLHTFYPADIAPGGRFGVEVAIDAEERLVLVAGNESVVSFDLDSRDHVATFDIPVGSSFEVELEAAAGSAVIRAGRESPILFNARTGEPIRTLVLTGPTSPDPADTTVAISPHHVLVGVPYARETHSEQGGVYIFDPKTGERTGYYRAPDPGTRHEIGAAIAIDGHRFVTGIDNAGSVGAHIVDARTAALVGVLTNPAPSTDESIAFSNGRAVLGTRSGLGVSFYDLAMPCSVIDLAPPFGIHDMADLEAWLRFALTSDPRADIAPPFGVLNIADTNAVGPTLAAGCP
ncbi:MAG: hypothetical protein AAGI53_02730 [Planctomycetota bacterium]